MERETRSAPVFSHDAGRFARARARRGSACKGDNSETLIPRRMPSRMQARRALMCALRPCSTIVRSIYLPAIEQRRRLSCIDDNCVHAWQN